MSSDIPVYCAFDKMVPVEDLKPNPRNPNQHPQKQIELLAKIIQGNGWRLPITVSNYSGFIVRGHGRLLAAKSLKLKEAPVDYQDYTSESKEWADLIADNQIPELAEMDEVIIKDLLIKIKKVEEIDLELTAFSVDEISGLLEGRENNLGGEPGLVPEKDKNVLVRLSFHPGLWLGKREEILGIVDKMKKAYECKAVIDE